ncbi:hypothetical protein EYB25_010038 [Talaromyces marneffei]|nr:hypothetical protein EYB25_010038 [Talaromyces marneffei]
MLLFIFAWVILTATTYCQTEASADNASLAVAPKLPFPCISKFGLKDCPSGESCCGFKCVDTNTNPFNCGQCLHICKDGTPNCCGGNCVNTQTDETNCGTCGHHCTAAAPECCGGTCTDTQTDALNCGMCGHACNTGDPDCCAGDCRYTDKSFELWNVWNFLYRHYTGLLWWNVYKSTDR